MTKMKVNYITENNNETDAKKRYSAYMKKLNDLAKKNEKKNRKEK